MHVDAAKPRNLQQPLGQYLAIGRHYADIWGYAFEYRADLLVVPDLGRLMNRNTMAGCELLHRRPLNVAAPPCGFVRLSEYRGQRMAVRDQPSQRRDRKFRRAHKDQPHLSIIFQSSSFPISDAANSAGSEL